MKRFSRGALAVGLAVLSPAAFAENLVENGSFEIPAVKGRNPVGVKSDPSGEERGKTWTHFQSMDRSGKVVVGMTNEIAKTGKQSIFVEFNKAEKTKQALLMSDLIPIKESEKYRISIWGRVDSKRPLTLDQGRPYMAVEIEFYPEDQASRIGETEIRTQMIPGMADRLLFVSSTWSEYYTEIKAPEKAEFMKVSFNWFSPKREGEADGVIYFDDAAVEGVRGVLKPSFDPPPPVEEKEEMKVLTPEEDVPTAGAPPAK